MFTHLILLNKSPYYIYAISEQDAINKASELQDDIVGIVVSDGLTVNNIKTKLVLETAEPKKIEQMVQVDEDTYEVLPEEEKEELSEELQSILDKDYTNDN